MEIKDARLPVQLQVDLQFQIQIQTEPRILCATPLVGTESVEGLYACIYWEKWRMDVWLGDTNA